MAARYIGFAVIDRCPVRVRVPLDESAELLPLGGLTAAPILELVSVMIGSPASAPKLEHDHIEAHQCCAVRVKFAGNSFESAYEYWKGNADIHYLPVLHWLRPPAEVLFTGVLDVESGEWRIALRLNRRTWQIAMKPNLQEYYGLARRVAAVDRSARLMLSLFQDFMREMDADHAILRAWSLLELLAQVAPEPDSEDDASGRMPKRVRHALRLLGVHVNVDFSVAELEGLYFDHDQDTVAAAYQRRNCLSHEGACDRANTRCSSRKYAGPCQHGENLRDDLEWLLHFALIGFVRRAAVERGIGLYVSASHGSVYHAEDCPYARKICEGNIVRHLSSPDAQRQGLSPCARCLTHIPIEDPSTLVVASP